MDTEVRQIFSEIVGQTSSELILFFVLFLVGLVLVFVPVFRMLLKHRVQRLAMEREQQQALQKQFVKVVSANTEIMTMLKAVIEHTSRDHKQTIERVHDRIDEILSALLSRPCLKDREKNETPGQ